MAITVHNERDKETLNEIARGHHAVCGLLGFCETMLRRWHEKIEGFSQLGARSVRPMENGATTLAT